MIEKKTIKIRLNLIKFLVSIFIIKAIFSF